MISLGVRGVEIWTYLQQPISGLCTYHAPTAATGYGPTGSLQRLQQPGKASTPRGTHTSLGAKFGEDSSQRIAWCPNVGPKLDLVS